ncbi:uncharacterized protein [Elaeis guineensis]|uniref:uncharacterized protein isoform X1 n=1 Tax=Elaeis guineensis var. tenera TaxID=51953 RepID=UPI003C6D0FCD
MGCDRRSGVSSSPPSSRKKKFHCSPFFSFCFGGAGGPPKEARPASLLRSSSTWLRSKAKELPELRERCRHLLSRIGGHRRRAGGFRYDPLSYALNFDEGDDSRGYFEAFRYRKPSGRLSVSPAPAPSGTRLAHETIKEIMQIVWSMARRISKRRNDEGCCA